MTSLLIKNIEIFAGLVAAVVLLAGHFAVELPFIFNLIVSIILFSGLLLIGSFWSDIAIKREIKAMTLTDMRRRIRDGLQKTSRIRGLAGTIQDREVRQKLQGIADLAERILKNLAKDETEVAKAGGFLVYLDRFLPLVERYTDFSSTPEGRELLLKTSDDAEFWELLHLAEQSFAQGYQNYLQDEAVEFRNLSRTLKKISSVSEISP